MAKLGKMIGGITGKTEAEIQQKERFSFLQKMAANKCEQYHDELKIMLSSDTIGDVEITGKRAFKYYSSQHVNISDKCDDAITGAIDDFFKGSSGVKDGFQKIVKQGLQGIIGNSSIGESEDKMFFVYPENFAIVRVDVKCYKYQFSSKGVFDDKVENVFCYTMCKSIVDHKKITIDELLYMIADMIGNDDKDPQARMKAVEAFITELKNVWKMLESSNPMPQTLLARADKELV